MRGSSPKLVAIALGLLFVAFGAKPLIRPEPYSPWQQRAAARVAMKLAVAKQVRHPAVLLGGGSNVLSGLRASVIAEDLGRPVYNLAVTDEAGDYHNALALLEFNAEPGDVLVYSSRGFLTTVPRLARSTPYDLEGLKLLLPDMRDVAELIDRSPLRLLIQTRAQAISLSPWELPGNYSNVGDYKRCLSNRTSTSAQMFSERIPGQDQFIEDLGSFSRRMAEKQIKVFFVMPDLLVVQGEEPLWKGLMQRVESAVAQSGGGWLNLGGGTTFIADAGEFCDTPLHPGPARATIKSKALARQLAEHI